MKKTDIAMIIFIATMSMMISYFVAKSIIGDSNDKPVTVKTTTSISESVKAPNKDRFNKEAINPTIEVTIGAGESKNQDATNDQTKP